jgi:replication factor C subunit 3/5
METGAREMADEMEVVEEHVSAVAKGDAGDAPAVAALATPWVEKYRPETLGDVIAHTDIVSTRELPRPARRAPSQQRYLPALPPPPPPLRPC